MPETEKPQPTVFLSGMQKAAVLLVALGADTAAKVLQQLAPDEIERLASGMVMLKRIDSDVRRRVLDECEQTLMDGGALGGSEFASRVLEEAVGEAKAKEMITKAVAGGADAFAWLHGMAPAQLAGLISGERPQVAALVIGHMPPEQAGQVLAVLPGELQGDVMLRLAKMQPTGLEFIKYLDEALRQQVFDSWSSALSEVGGCQSVARLLSNVDRTAEKKIMEYLAKSDQEVADRVKETMFVFEDILSLDDRAIQIILRDVPQEDLRLALKGCPEETRQVFYRNISQRVADSLKEDLESSGPARRRDVDAAQGRIANVARRLDEAGEISLRGAEEELVP